MAKCRVAPLREMIHDPLSYGQEKANKGGIKVTFIHTFGDTFACHAFRYDAREKMVWRDAVRVPKDLSLYLDVEEGLPFEGNQELLAQRIREVVLADAQLHRFPSLDRFSSLLWGWLKWALQQKADEGYFTEGRDQKAWELVLEIGRLEGNREQRKHGKAFRERVSLLSVTKCCCDPGSCR